MKKSLIALAVLAASGAAMAQSSVTVYGLADVWFGSVKNTLGVPVAAGDTSVFGVDGAAAVGSIRNTKLESGGVNSSRWGIKGSEDLGGGLKANFLLEQGFSIDSGSATAGQAFSRQSYVGLSGGFGEVKLGKVWTAYDDVSGASNAVFDSKLAPLNHVFVSTDYDANPANTIYYATPSFSGFAGAVSYSLGENKTATTSATAVTAFNVTYAAGPLAAQLGYQVQEATTGPDAKYTRLGGSYDFGVVVAKATYGKVSNYENTSGNDADEYQFGVDVPVSSALTVSASYASSKDDVAGFDQKRSGYGIAASYTLSKRTFVYAGYNSNKATNDGAADDKLSILAVGLQHRF